jgi:hypothetical protein
LGHHHIENLAHTPTDTGEQGRIRTSRFQIGQPCPRSRGRTTSSRDHLLAPMQQLATVNSTYIAQIAESMKALGRIGIPDLRIAPFNASFLDATTGVAARPDSTASTDEHRQNAYRGSREPRRRGRALLSSAQRQYETVYTDLERLAVAPNFALLSRRTVFRDRDPGVRVERLGVEQWLP